MKVFGPLPRPLERLVNFVAYQITWFTAVYNGNGIGLPLIAAFLLLHTQFAREGEWKLISCFAITGICLDTLWMNLGLTYYPENSEATFLPLWMMGLWFAVSTTLTHAINPFFRRPIAVTIMAAIIAPYAYSVGSEAGGMVVTEAGYYAVAAGWSTLMFIASFTVRYIRPDLIGLEH